MQKSHAKNEQKLTKKHRKGLNATHRGIYFEEYPPSLERRFEKKDKDINMQNSQFWNFCLNSFFIFPNKIKNDFWRGEGGWFFVILYTPVNSGYPLEECFEHICNGSLSPGRGEDPWGAGHWGHGRTGRGGQGLRGGQHGAVRWQPVWQLMTTGL